MKRIIVYALLLLPLVVSAQSYQLNLTDIYSELFGGSGLTNPAQVPNSSSGLQMDSSNQSYTLPDSSFTTYYTPNYSSSGSGYSGYTSRCTGQLRNLGDLACMAIDLINRLTVLVVALALLYFLWGVAKYINSAGNQAKHGEAIQQMMYGVVALFVMVSVWGLVNLLSDTFMLRDSQPDIPSFRY